MASSNVIASRSPANSDLPRQSPTSPLNLHSDQPRGFSMNMDELLRNIYSDPTSFPLDNNGAGLPAIDDHANGDKSVDGVWAAGDTPMTLEDFLAKAGAVSQEDVRVPPPPPPPPTVGAFGIETVMMHPVPGIPAAQFTPLAVDFGSGMPAVGGRGKRRVAVEEPPLDKATQQKQRRMIKNRESAARSRERKQAYTVELESMVSRLEVENARLLKEEVELNKERYKQLMENLIPVEEVQRHPKVLRRVRSAEW